MEFSKFTECTKDLHSKTILTANVILDKETILNALKGDSICIFGKLYKVPEQQFLLCLLNKHFGLQTIEFEEIKINKDEY
jgi:hypothetical protein